MHITTITESARLRAETTWQVSLATFCAQATLSEIGVAALRVTEVDAAPIPRDGTPHTHP